MAGFRSPLFVLGIGTTAADIKRGFRTPIPVLNMGTGAPAANEVGFRTPLPFWNGGATAYILPEPEIRLGGGGHAVRDHHARILREDEDILAVIMAYMETRH